MIQVAHRVFDILELLASSIDREFRLGEIADQLQLNHATCANILKTMINRGYITKVYPHKTYTLGPMVFQLPRSRNYQRSLVRTARPVMEQLAESLQEAVVLTILEQGRCYIIDEVQSTLLPVVQFDPLYIRDLSTKATTRVLLAHLSRPERESALLRNQPEQSDWWQTGTAEAWHSVLDQIRLQPVHSHMDGDAVGLAVPVWQNDSVIAALGVHLPLNRLNKHNPDFLNEQIMRAAASLRTLLSWPY